MTRVTMSSVPLPSATALDTWTMARAPASLWRATAREYYVPPGASCKNNNFRHKAGRKKHERFPAAPNSSSGL